MRLDGLPLALATAGSYLSQTTGTFGDYLQLYEDRLEELEQNSEGLLEYDDRRLWTTWVISLKQIESHDPEAVKLMQLLAYFDNQDIWYGLLRPGGDYGLPWLSDVVRNEIRFNRAMAKLHDYSLIDVRLGSYSIHACLHDWALGFLNCDLNSVLYGAAVHCVALNVLVAGSPGSHMGNRRLLQHAIRLQSGRLKSMMDSNMVSLRDLLHIALLYHEQDEFKKAGPIYLRVLQVTEQNESMWSRGNISRLEILHNLGIMYMLQGRLAEAEELLLSALAEPEKLHGREDMTTIGVLNQLSVLNGLGALYLKQGKMAEAEETILKALAGLEQTRGSEHVQTLGTKYYLGRCYMDQGKMAGAEAMFLQALTGFEKVCGQEHESTLFTVRLLAELYARQEKMTKAVEMYKRAIEGHEKEFGPEQTRTLGIVRDLGWAYWKQGKLVEAEQMYLRALAGYEKTLGPDHKLTLETADGLEHLQNLREEYDRVSSPPSSMTAATTNPSDDG
jgi:tetratricopeptide (TPR) repeat protein